MSDSPGRLTYVGPHVVIEGRRYPVLLSTPQAAVFLGLSEHRLRQKIGTEQLPIEPVRLGRLHKWPTVAIARLAGLDPRVVDPDAKIVKRTPEAAA